MASSKEEILLDGLDKISSTMNEIVVNALGRHDPNTYECVARNAVPPATSRIFYFEIQCKLENKSSI